jgi:hypothetical protein
MSDNLRVKRLCTRRWEDLVGNDIRRFCAECAKSVYNVDAMSRSEIDALRRVGGFCATYIGDEGGAFAIPQPTPPTSSRPTTAVAAAVLVSILGGCSSGEPPASPAAITEKPVVSEAAECEKKAPPSDAFARLTPEEQAKARDRLRFLGYVE